MTVLIERDLINRVTRRTLEIEGRRIRLGIDLLEIAQALEQVEPGLLADRERALAVLEAVSARLSTEPITITIGRCAAGEPGCPGAAPGPGAAVAALAEENRALAERAERAAAVRVEAKSLIPLIDPGIHTRARVSAYLAGHGWTHAYTGACEAVWRQEGPGRYSVGIPAAAASHSAYRRTLARTVRIIASAHGCGDLAVLDGIAAADPAAVAPPEPPPGSMLVCFDSPLTWTRCPGPDAGATWYPSDGARAMTWVELWHAERLFVPEQPHTAARR